MGRPAPRPTGLVAPLRSGLLALVVPVLLLAACTSADDGADDAGPAAADDTAGRTDGGDGSDEAGEVVDGAGGESQELVALEIMDPVDIQLVPRVLLPVVPAIALPDLSELGPAGIELSDRLAGLVQPTAGIDVIGAACETGGGELVYQGASGESFFDLAEDGSGVFRDREGANDLEITVEADGSGTYRDRGNGKDVEIAVEADGAGVYREDRGTSQLEIVVEADGSGTYRDRGNDIDVEIVVGADGSGLYRDASFSNDLEIRVGADGSGSFRNQGANNDVTIDQRADGSWTFVDRSHNLEVDLVVNADGSGTLTDRSGSNGLAVDIDAEGRGTMVNDFLDFAVAFTTEVGILDPDLLDIGPLPVFAVADRFPPLDSLARLEPPCATVVRLGSDVLFDFDSAELRPETLPIIDQLAEALTDTGGPIEIHGHTDAVGDEAYNQDLAGRRAAAFAAALVERGVTAELRILSFGETRPAAPNERPDGSDDPAGRQLNRRIEVVVAES